MREDSYVVIQSFMVDELHLKGNELIVYATIYGFTQDGSHWFYGTRGYLAEWCGAKRETVDRCLKDLLEKGYIERRDVEEHGHVSVQYRATKNVVGTQKTDTPPKKSSTPTPKNMHINNLVQPNDTKDNKEERRVNSFTADPWLRRMLMTWIDCRRQMKAPLTDRALEMALAKLSKMAASDEDRAAIVEQSVINGWRGLFPLKGGTRKVDAGGDVSQYNYF